MKIPHIRQMRILSLSMFCFAVGVIAGSELERPDAPSGFDEVLGLLVHSCMSERSYEKLLQRQDIEPLRISGDSGTDFDKIHGDGKGTPFVVNITTDEDGKDVFYQLEYEVVEGVDGSRLAGFRVFCLYRKDNRMKSVVQARRRIDLE